MTPQSSPDAGASGGVIETAAAYGVAVPRPRLLLVVLALIAACILVLTAIDLATLSAQIASLSSTPGADKLPRDAMRASQLNSSLFIAALMFGVLALIAFGHNWARWVWMLVCMLMGLLVAVGSLALMFSYAPQAAMAKCAVYLVLFVLSCMLFAPSSNAWFRQIKDIRNNPRLNPAFASAAPAAAPLQGESYHPYAPPGAMAGAPAGPVTLPPRARTVTVAVGLLLLNAVAGMVLGVIYMPEVLATQNVPLGDGWMKNVVYGGIAFGIVLMLVLMYFIARGSNVARWIWLVMSVIGFLNAYSAVKTAFVISPLYGTLATISQLIALAGTILLFVPASNQWMRAVAQARRP
ncbi:hypothetical protein HF313_12940 [Massilia atriviolacea]|uniref:Uncharacterized protein n=1 Tax=Massilia atriviolacea TaxID=2495579 RepID=A0A430HQ60_9BURK|nr:hypothetical protein [Massilia atriviolacea]RSZ59652.1 hypothetical protein EJB06_05490 [Massilia atriviolacea]